MSAILNSAYSPDHFQQLGHELIDLLADYLRRTIEYQDSPVLPWRSPTELKEHWQTDLSRNEPADPMRLWKEIISGSIHLHHPGCVGHQVVPPVPLAALTDLISDLLNNSMAVYEVGPVSTVLELIVGEWLAERMGMGHLPDDPPAGIFTSGGSIGNLTGLLAARQSHGGSDIWENGVCGRQLAVMVSSQSHYSVSRALKVMGLGEAGVIPLEVDEQLRVRPELLEEVFTRESGLGKNIFAMVGNACSTSTGVYDPLPEMAAFCKKKSIWFHVDGAHGAGAALTSKYRHLTEGIGEADSLVVDFHKMLLCPALTTAVLFRNTSSSFATFAQKADYLLSDNQDIRRFDLAGRTLECTKKMMAIKVYMLLRVCGEALFSEYITRTYDLSREFAGLLLQNDQFELFVPPQANIICFRFRPAGMNPDEIDSINTRIRRSIMEAGRFYIVQTRTPKGLFLRATLMNPFTTLSDLQSLLQEITAAGKV